jgi:hypothetical protein
MVGKGYQASASSDVFGTECGMGWKVSGLIAEGPFDPSQLPGRPQETGECIDLDLAYSRVVDYAIAGVDGWTAIVDPQFLTFFGDDAAPVLSGTSRALSFVTHSVSDTHGFEWFLNGESVWRVIYSQGEIADEYGDALPEENDLPDWIDEDFIFEIIWRLTGLAWGEVAHASYRVWSRAA